MSNAAGRDRSWRHAAAILGWCAIGFGAASSAFAQPGGAPKSQSKGAPPAAAAKGDDSNQAPAEAEKPDAKSDEVAKTESQEFWFDPKSEAALENNFPELNAPASLRDTDRDQVLKQQADVPTIKKYIDFYAAELARRNNIKALMEGGESAGDTAMARKMREDAKKMETSVAKLLAPVQVANPNPAFRRSYVTELLKTLVPLLKRHLHTRTMAMMVVSRLSDPAVMPICIEQLDDNDQLAAVKLLAAVGIRNVARAHRTSMDSAQAYAATRALTEFLVREGDVFWPVQVRAVESLGWLRLGSGNINTGRAEACDALVRLLCDPRTNIEVRAYAGWALGWIPPPPDARNYNYQLVAHGIGEAAAELGSRIGHLPDTSPAQVARLGELLLQLLIGLTGDPTQRNTGLLKQNLGAAEPYVAEVEKKVRAIAQATIALNNSVGRQLPTARAAVQTAADDLRAMLKKPPSSLALYAGAEPIELSAPGAADDAAADPSDGESKPQSASEKRQGVAGAPRR